MRRSPVVILGLALFVGACQAPRPNPDVRHFDPAVKIPAMKTAVRENDLSAIAPLIEDLDSDDPAVRLYAIQALQRMTGEELGYRYWDDSMGRAPAIARWHQWLADQQEAGSP